LELLCVKYGFLKSSDSSASEHFDFHFLWTKRAGGKTKRLKRALGTRGGIGFEFLHNKQSFLRFHRI
jgi:hypothetical protein